MTTTCAWACAGGSAIAATASIATTGASLPSYRIGLGENDQVTIGGEVRERRYPSGPLRSRTRDIAELTGSWTHSLAERPDLADAGRATDPGMGHAGSPGRRCLDVGRQRRDRPFVQRRPRRVLSGGLTSTSRTTTSARIFTTDPDLLRVRNDDLWNFGGGLVWGFGSGWSVRPTVEYNWEDSNIDALAYSSTEMWITVRKSF